MRAIAVVAAVALTAATWVAPAAARTPATDYQADIASWTNVQRENHDLTSLRRQACVQRYAERQARKMAAREELFHQDLQRVLRDCKLQSAGENVAYGFDDGRSVVVDGWMESPPHRANILHAAYRLLGAGARLGDDGLWYAVQVFGGR